MRVYIVQDMACDTVIKIVLKSGRHFVVAQIGEPMPLLEEILSTISSIICDLQLQQVCSLIVLFKYKNKKNYCKVTLLNHSQMTKKFKC